MTNITNFEARFMGTGIIVDPSNDNADVMVHLGDGKDYIATFFTIKNIEANMKRHATTGESLFGQYFWASDIIIVDELSQSRVNAVVKDLLREDLFHKAFRLRVV